MNAPVDLGYEPSIDTIIQLVAACCRTTPRDIRSDRRDGHTVAARHIAMLLARERTHHSYPAIGRHFGGRDHTTVINGVSRARKRIECEPELSAAYTAAQRALTFPTGDRQ